MQVGDRCFDHLGEYEITRIGELSISYRYVGSDDVLSISKRTAERLHQKHKPKVRLRKYESTPEFEDYLLKHGWLSCDCLEVYFDRFTTRYLELTGVQLNSESVGVSICLNKRGLALAVGFPKTALGLVPTSLNAVPVRSSVGYEHFQINNNEFCWDLIEKGLRFGLGLRNRTKNETT